MTDTTTPHTMTVFHWGRSWAGTELEDTCPCPKAPCGLIETGTADPECGQHAIRFAKTSRQGHRANACPAASTALEG